MQGPDIFYAYRALSFPNTYKINKLGGKIHKRSFKKFMNMLFEKNELPISDDLFSYIAGFICHFSLDSICHPYIDKAAEKNNITHGEIEMEFDRTLLEMKGFDPLTTKLSDLISVPNVKNKALKEMAKAFKGYKKITPKILARSINDYKFFKKFFYSPFPFKQKILRFLCKVLMINKVYDSCVMKTKSNPKSFITNTGLIFLFYDCVEDACSLIKNFSKRCNSPKTKLSKNFNRTFV